MSKEYLEALESLKTALHNEWLRFYPQFKELDEKTKSADGVRMVSSDADAFLTVKQALERLEAIDNANSSEALECLELIINFIKYHWELTNYKNEVNIIKQALLKVQEQDKILDILKKKNVNIYQIKFMENLDCYNSVKGKEDKLTQEEFDLLKRWAQ